MNPSRILIIFSFLSLISSELHAQDSFQEYKRQQNQAFQSYKNSQDSAFASILGQEWIKQAVEVPIPIVEDKPLTPPSNGEVNLPQFEKRERVTIPTTNAVSPDEVISIVPTRPEKSEDFDEVSLYIEKSFAVPSEFYSYSITDISQKGIQKWWDEVTSNDYETWIEYFVNKNRIWPLNGWNFYQQVTDYTKNQFTGKPNQATLFTWFIMLKSGYDVRIGTHAGSLYLLFSTTESLYNQEFFRLDGKRYYVSKPAGSQRRIGQISTYKGQPTTGLIPISLSINQFPKHSNEQLITQTLQFAFEKQQIEVSVPLSLSRIEQLESYPQTDFKVYFEAPLEDAILSRFQESFQPYLDSLGQEEAINFLLRFVQTSFGYKVDADQFGKEKHLFAEETLYYPYSDCEDRAVLFAQLVHHLLGLEVVGLQYPEHVATAVLLDSPVGDTINVNGNLYTIADPTYIHADAGMTIPNLKEKSPQVIQYIPK